MENEGGGARMRIVFLCVGCSILTSVIVTKILATRYFKIVDGYVQEVCCKTKEFVENVKSLVCKI